MAKVFFTKQPLTVYEIAERNGVSIKSARNRIAKALGSGEIKRAGLLHRTGFVGRPPKLYSRVS